MDLDLRKLRYFVAVARHRHFGRAAEELFIAQPVLSRQIRAFEQELGCALLVRTTRSVELTEAGRQLQEEAQAVLASVDLAVRRVHEADQGAQRLVVAFAAGLHVSEAIREFTARHPHIGIGVLPLSWREQDVPLRDGRAHVAFLRRPFHDTGMRTVPIGTDLQVACLSARHPLAERPALTLAELSGETVLDGHSRRISSLEEKMELIAAGHGIAQLPASVARAYTRPDLVHREVTDAPPFETCLALLKGRRERRLLDFLAVATPVLRGATSGSPVASRPA
ncbi:DNA-binding transcriptional LysR family regulator [Crossiella equi]|uniref:DNA-binding transcriptional LysR family regulator n=1 Tax=Crossiella equi TaxID=130796 RepID=A0ABS5A4S4_9PSEU|nr:LysR family transcriptional regulator [Crossiella equi]MBP2471577.1 DNA-binding transcriptional LysR family regulator [Crossiella equi]